MEWEVQRLGASLTECLLNSFLLMKLICLCPTVLLVLVWTTVIPISGVFPNPIYTTCKVFKRMLPELYLIQGDILESFLFSRYCIISILSIGQWLKLPHYFTNFFTLVFLSILMHIVPFISDLVTSQFSSSVYKSVQQFSYKFALLRNELPDEI